MMTPHAGLVFLEKLEQVELTLPQAKVLLALKHNRAMSELMMCTLWDMKQPALKKLLEALVKRGLVVQTDEAHGLKWTTTGSGAELVRRITKGC